MQRASLEYKASMNNPMRNRGYIKAVIGVINSEAQNNIVAKESDNSLTYFADYRTAFEGYKVTKPYATQEQNFTRLDGSMYFLPPQNEGYEFYNNGIVTNSLKGSVKVTFGSKTDLEIKGLTIDFGESFPTSLTVKTNVTERTYTNSKRVFITEDVFYNVSEITITPNTMVDGQTRMRIYSFECGIANSFANDEVMDFSSKEYVSSITDTIPSMDISLSVDNQNLYYSPDNPESTLAYFEVGQKIHVQFGYDVEGNGEIEWLPETVAYLKTWKATDQKATFTATDRFDYLSDTYYKGKVHNNGISLYDLALDVISDAGITDVREYWVDPYLKDIKVNNPMPPVTHAEALQIIANAGRCVLFEDRNSKIHIQSSFIPDMEASTNSELSSFSKIANVLNGEVKDAVALTSKGFSLLSDEKMYFAGDSDHIHCGYISDVMTGSDGTFTTNPTITVELESGYIAYGLGIDFRNVAAEEFTVQTYFDGEAVETFSYVNSDINFRTSDIFELFDKMVITFTKGSPYSRVFVDNVLIGDVTEYHINNADKTAYATATRQSKIKQIDVVQTRYTLSTEDIQDLSSGELIMSKAGDFTVYFSTPCYGYQVDKNLNEGETANYTLSISDSSAYFVKFHVGNITEETTVKYVIRGYEYVESNQKYSKAHNASGDSIEWTNPLISAVTHAKDIEEWLASYYLGDVDYEISWRGDPRTDANDLFYLELLEREPTMIRAYQNELKYSGSWSGKMKARKAVL